MFCTGTIFCFLSFLKDFIYLFQTEGKEGRKRGRDTSVCGCLLHSLHPPPGAWPATQASAPTGNQTSDPLVGRLVFNPLSHTSQGSIAFLDVLNSLVQYCPLRQNGCEYCRSYNNIPYFLVEKVLLFTIKEDTHHLETVIITNGQKFTTHPTS